MKPFSWYTFIENISLVLAMITENKETFIFVINDGKEAGLSFAVSNKDCHRDKSGANFFINTLQKVL